MSEDKFFMENTETRKDITKMWEHVLSNLKLAFDALHNTDVVSTGKVIAEEENINKLHITIERSAINFMATRQPVASNLRALISIFKISKSLERIGDYAVHIAKEGARLADLKYPGKIEILESMVQIGIEMLDDVYSAFENEDGVSAREIANRDDIVDKKYKDFISDILANIANDPQNADMYTRLVSTVNSVERLCDHITDICESIVYMAESKYIDLNEK